LVIKVPHRRGGGSRRSKILLRNATIRKFFDKTTTAKHTEGGIKFKGGERKVKSFQGSKRNGQTSRGKGGGRKNFRIGSGKSQLGGKSQTAKLFFLRNTDIGRGGKHEKKIGSPITNDENKYRTGSQNETDTKSFGAD